MILFQIRWMALLGCVAFPVLSIAQSFINANASLPNAYHSGNCVGFTDVNGDGYDDVVVLDQSKILKILYQSGDGTLTEVDYGNVSANNQWGMTIGDYDNDGHKDVFSGGAYDGVHVKNIDPDGWTEFDLDNGSMFMQACNFADIDADGQLDVFGCHDDALSRMWRGNGENLDPDASLIDLTNYDYSDYPNTDHSGNYGTVFCDVDQDGDLDLTIAKCRQFVNDPNDPRRINQLWINNGDGTWSEEAADRGLVLFEQTWTVDYADVDNDGDWDCFMTNHSTTMKLLENDGFGYFSDITAAAGLDFSGFALQAKLADLDSDGYVDVLVAGGIHRYYRNNGDGTFTQEAAFPGSDIMHSFAMGDMNRDGFIDVYASYGNGYNSPDNGNDDVLWVNEGNDNHWIAFQFQGITSNLDAVGTKVTITGDFGTQIREVRAGESYGITNTFSCMFGLGTHEAIETVTVQWPSGLVTTMENPLIDQYHEMVEAECTTVAELILPESLVLCPGESLEIQLEGTFSSYEWSDGSSSEILEVTNPGVYSVVVIDSEGCYGVSETVSVDMLEPETPQIFIDGEDIVCAGTGVELSGPPNGQWIWSTGEVTSSIMVAETGMYSLTFIDACGTSNQSDSVAIEVVEIPSNPVIEVPANGAYGETIALASSDVSTHWYETQDADSPIHIGGTFETVFFEETELWVEAVNDSNIETATGGRTGMGSGQYHDNSFRWLVFDAYEDLVIHQVDVFANGAGVREFGVVDANGVPMVTASFDLMDGMNTVELDFEVPAGTGYGFRCFSDNPQLWRDGVGTTMEYPYALGELGQITESTAGGSNALNYYYFFYNWHVESAGVACASERISVPIAFDVSGCMDESACNFDANAEEEDGSCTYPGCEDAGALNYDEAAGCQGPCEYLNFTCSEIGSTAWSFVETGVYPGEIEAVFGIPTAFELVLSVAATSIDPGSGVAYAVSNFEVDEVNGLPSGLTFTELPAAIFGANQICLTLAGTPEVEGIFYVELTGELFIELFGQPFSTGTTVLNFEITIVPNPNPVEGCTYPAAANFNPFATDDDGSCEFPGCLDPEALNFSQHFNADGGECVYETSDTTCTEDVTGDGAVNVADLLALLSSFGAVCD